MEGFVTLDYRRRATPPRATSMAGYVRDGRAQVRATRSWMGIDARAGEHLLRLFDGSTTAAS
jgi:hypothetical protein